MLRKLIYNDEDVIREDDHRMKVWPIEPDQDVFREVMNTQETDDISSLVSKDHRLIDCYQYFVEEISNWTHQGEYSPEERLEALKTALWGLVRLVGIDLETLDDSQVIFETLNARGTPLLAGDLIKNFLFREANRSGQPADELHSKYWKQFDEEEWREEVVQGRLERPRIDVFLMHWLTMRTASQVRAKKLFPTFQSYLKRTENSIEEVLVDIDHYAQVYRTFSEPYSNNREGVFFRRLDVLDTTTPLPGLLWLYGNDSISSNQRQIAVETIESWLVRRMLCRATAKNYNNIFLDLLIHLQKSEPKEADTTVVEFFKSKEGASEYWPADSELKEAMTENPYWSRINQRRLKMVFRALERDLRDTGYSEGLAITEKLHIEHLLPQEWAHHWDLPGERPEEVERIERDEVKHTIGNLTVLTEKLNPSISNAAWEKKREAIDDHSVLLLNRKLVDLWYDRWDESTIADRGEWLSELATDESTIADRGEWLSELATEVWPGPDVQYWE